jgi:hypothetical protein
VSPETVTQVCIRLLNARPNNIECVQAQSGRSVRVFVEGQAYIVAHSTSSFGASHEAGVLQALHEEGAPVPRVIAYDDEWLIQDDLGSRRVSESFGAGNLILCAMSAQRALQGLLQCHHAAQNSLLAQRLPQIGCSTQWLDTLLSIPQDIATRLSVASPSIRAIIDPQTLLPRHHSFIKWNAQPDNAIILADDGIGWTNWEECGTRDALDDLATVLCNEHLPDNETLEQGLLKRSLSPFATTSKRTLPEALVYLSRFGTLHTCAALQQLLTRQNVVRQPNPDNSTRQEHTPTSATDLAKAQEEGNAVAQGIEKEREKEKALRLCKRGARWALRWPGGEAMHQFFNDVQNQLNTEQKADLHSRHGPVRAARAEGPDVRSSVDLRSI